VVIAIEIRMCLLEFQVGVSLKASFADMLSRMPLEDTDGMTLNDTIKAGDDTALAGSEDCLHLAVFTPRVNNNI
jgi:hypothetical protein